MVGYGNNPPTRPHHRAASCPDRPASCTYDSAFNAPGPNPQVGAVVVGMGAPSASCCCMLCCGGMDGFKLQPTLIHALPHATSFPTAQVVAGALVGGPNSSDQYEDKRSDFQAK